MRKEWEDAIAEVVKSAGLKEHERTELQKELYSHFAEKEKELGANINEKTTQATLQQFGNPKIIGRELLLVHKTNIRIFIGLFIVVTLLATSLAANPLGTGTSILAFMGYSLLLLAVTPVASFFSPLSWVCIAVNGLLYFLLKFIKNREGLKQINIPWLLGSGAILQWWSIFLSYKQINTTVNYSVFATSGFPFTIFEFSSPTMNGGIPLQTWPLFFASYLFWLAISFIINYYIPKKITENRGTTYILVAYAIIVSMLGFGRLLIQFD